jgi:predicted short-subunit dehydrogenase-like oxidoreductase (DUF2520 family)
MYTIQKIGIIGSGNVATCLAHALQAKGFFIDTVFSRDITHAQNLASQLHGTKATNNLHALDVNLDVYFMAVTDDAIIKTASQIKLNGLVVHTSGSVGLAALETQPRRGVFYPLQTITKNTAPNFEQVPILIEAADKTDENILLQLATSLSNRALLANSEQRQSLHLAAVFANNFTNHLMGIAKQILQQSNLPNDLLNPLILQTAQNAINNNPFDVQTGPVMRNDLETINTHLNLLQHYPQYRQVYELLSGSIGALKHQKKV